MVLKKEVTQWAKECIQCQDSKILTHVRAPLDNFSVPDKRFSHIHVDLVGPLPPSSGYTHIFTIVDRTTRWPEAISLRETSTIDRAKSLSAPGSPVSVSHKTLLLTGGQSPRTIPRWTKPPDGQNPPVDKTPLDKTPPDKTPRTKPPRTKPPRTKPPRAKLPRTKPPRTKPPRTKPPRTKPPRTKPPGQNPPGQNPPEQNPP